MKPNATLKKRLLVIAGAALALNAAVQGCAFDDTTDERYDLTLIRQIPRSNAVDKPYLGCPEAYLGNAESGPPKNFAP